MSLRWTERQGLRLVGWRLRGMQNMRRWLPLLGVAVLGGTVALRALGLDGYAAALEQVGGLTGVSSQSPVGLGELAAATAALTGVVLKVRAEWKKATAPDDVVKLRP